MKLYLGKATAPKNYYESFASEYRNAQADAIEKILTVLGSSLSGTILDLGCGDGLGTKLLLKRLPGPFIGLDCSPAMVKRYRRETGGRAVIANFWDTLPHADTAIALHCLHLCPPSRLWQVRWQLAQAGVHHLLVSSPFKATGNLGFEVVARCTAASPASGCKTVWGWMLGVTPDAGY